jgi:26S proteasome regulatory subunit T2
VRLQRLQHPTVAHLQERVKPAEERNKADHDKIDELRGSPLSVGTLEEIIDESHAIVSTSVGPEYYVGVLQLVDKTQLEPGCSVLLHNKAMAIVGILSNDTDPMVSVMKVDQAPTESFADIGGLEAQIQVHFLFCNALCLCSISSMLHAITS